MTKVRHTHKRNEVIDKIIELRIDKGYTILSIIDYLTNEMKFAKSYAYELVRDARAEIDNKSLQLFGDTIKEDIERFESLYQNAILNKNIKEARELLKEISKLKGHYVERVEHSGSVEHKIDVIKIITPPDEKEV